LDALAQVLGGIYWLAGIAVLTAVTAATSWGLARIPSAVQRYLRYLFGFLVLSTGSIVLLSVVRRYVAFPVVGALAESRPVLLVFFLGLCLLYLAKPKRNNSGTLEAAMRSTAFWIVSAALILFMPTIGSDGAYYYGTARSLLHDGDLNLYNEAAFHPYGWMTFSVRSVSEQGYTFNPFPIGHSLFLIPWLILGEVGTGIANLFGWNLLHDGYAPPVRYAAGLGCFAYALLGAFCMTRFAFEFVKGSIAAWACVVAALGSPVLYYINLQCGFPHALGMPAVSLIVWTWWRARRGERFLDWAIVGSACGLATLVRWQYVLYFLVPFLDSVITSFEAGKSPVRRLGCLLVAAASLGATLLVQILFFNVTSDTWLPTGYPASLFDFLHPQISKTLFGAAHGLFTWHPIVLLGLLGLFVVPRKARRPAFLLGLVFLLQLWVTAAYKPGYHGGGGFGNRLFDHALPAVALGLAVLRDRLARWGAHWERGLVIAVGALVIWNILFMLMVVHAPFNDYQEWGAADVIRLGWEAFALKFSYHLRFTHPFGLLWNGLYFHDLLWTLAGLLGAGLLGSIGYFGFLWARRYLSEAGILLKWTSLGLFHGYLLLLMGLIFVGTSKTETLHAVELTLSESGPPDAGLSYRRYRINSSRSTFQGGLGEIHLEGKEATAEIGIYPPQEAYGLILVSKLRGASAANPIRGASGQAIGRVDIRDTSGKVTSVPVGLGKEIGYEDETFGLVPVRNFKKNNWDWSVYHSYAQSWEWSRAKKLASLSLESLSPAQAWDIEGVALLLSPRAPFARKYPAHRRRTHPSRQADFDQRFIPVDLSGVAHSDWSFDPSLIGFKQPGPVSYRTLAAGRIGTREIPIRVLPSFAESGHFSTLTTHYLHGTPENPIAVPIPNVRAIRLWVGLTGIFIETDERELVARFRFLYADGTRDEKRLRANRDIWDFDRRYFPLYRRIWDESNVHHGWGRIGLISINLNGEVPLEKILIEDANGAGRAGIVIVGMTLETIEG
jgi:hypothetical protein